jgi:hypothetical protein
MKIINLTIGVFLLASICFCESKKAESDLNVFTYNRKGHGTDLFLQLNPDNSFILIGLGGGSDQSADCAIKSKGMIKNDTLLGHLMSINTEVTSYKIKNISAYPFVAVLSGNIFEIIEGSVDDFCGLNASFTTKYNRVVSAIELQNKTNDCIDEIKNHKGNEDLLPCLKRYLSQQPEAEKQPQETFSIDISAPLNSAHSRALSLFKNGQKKDAASASLDFLNSITIDENAITQGTVDKFNDLGFFLEQGGECLKAIPVLLKVVERFPARTVAYLNLADAYWGVNNNLEANNNYSKYVALMRENGKELKIPKRAIDRSK